MTYVCLLICYADGYEVTYMAGCYGEGDGNDIMDLREAKILCYLDKNCVGIHDDRCKNRKLRLCKSRLIISMSTPSCVHKKQERRGNYKINIFWLSIYIGIIYPILQQLI